MTALLASVASLDEIEPAISGGADVIDLKDPHRGALGAWPGTRIPLAVARVAGRRLVSATVGDLPMVPRVLAQAAARTARTGVDVIKVGFFAGGNPRACIRALSQAPLGRARLVAVLFADRNPDLGLLAPLAEAGVQGIMVDTADKAGPALRGCVADTWLARFTDAARAHGLAVGLAGSLAVADVAPLLALAPDFLGFRGALCGASGRRGVLDPAAVAAVRAALAAGRPQAYARAASQATAAAGAQVAAQWPAPGSASMSAAKST